MEWYEIELDGRRTCNFPERALPGGSSSDNFTTQPEGSQNTDCIGGIINNGEWGWMTCQTLEETTLLICCLSTGDRVAHYTFWRENQKPPGERCTIVCVAELFPGENERRLLAVCLALEDLPGTQVAIFSPVGSQVLRYIDLDGLKSSVCTMNFINRRCCGKTALQELDGCLVLGTDSGALLLLDLNAQQTLHCSNSNSSNINRPDNEVLRAEVLRGFLDDQRNWNFVRGMVRRARDLDMHLAVEVQLQCVPKGVAITSLLPIEAICGFAIGLEDGLIIIYDLKRCQVVTELLPPANEPPAMVESLCCVLPLDDPKPCLYICAVYNSPGSHLITSLHSIIYQQQEGGTQLKEFQAGHTRLRLLLDEVPSRVICCSTIHNAGSLLIALGWHSPEQSKNKLVLLDINQWYSEGLPSHAAQKPNYLSGYVLSGLNTGLALQLDEKSVMYFQGLQHHDEHYFPNALSFDCSLLTQQGCRRYSHLGVQRRFLNSLYNQQANLLLNPQPYQQEIMRLRLMPQFCEQQVDAVFSKRGMYELIFSVALEHNRMSLLKKCAQSCLDGSFMCNMSNPTQLSLSMLTKWMVTRAEQIKDYITEMCHCIFDVEGYQLEEREQREFGQLNVQLYRLWQLQQQLLELGKGRLPVEVLEDLQHKEQAFNLLYEYQRVLYWIIDVGLLPECLQLRPLRVIKQDYQERRHKRIGRLYIDEMLQRSGLTQALQQAAESAAAAARGGGALYPPQSFRTLLQLMLFPDSLVLHKHELLLYLLLDLDSISTTTTTTKTLLFDEFALAFNVSKTLLNSVRSFWFLDRGQCERCLLELQRNARESSHEYVEWQTRLLLKQLLTLGALQQAMQVVQHAPGHIPSQLQLEVLLANNNIPEAFHHARLYENEAGRPLLEHFFGHCISARKFNVLGSLCLREEEEQLVYRLLRQCKTRKADCVQLILLLKRCKYIEAVSFMDEVAAERSLGAGIDSDDPSTILSAYRHTMAPVNQTIAGKYFRIRNTLNGAQLRNVAPEPFSCQLAKQSANGMLGGIFQSSALSAHWATRYAHEPRMLQGPNMPFLRNAAVQDAVGLLPSSQRRIVRPTPHQQAEKRALEQERQLEEGREVSVSKRRRLLSGGEQFTQDVGNFVQRMQQLKQAERERQQELDRQEEQQRDQQQLLALMQPPEYLQQGERKERIAVGAGAGAGQGAGVVPAAILRRRATAAEAVQRRSRYSFMAPIPLARCRQEEEEVEVEEEQQEVQAEEQQQHQESEQEQQQLEEEEEETDEIIVEIEQENSSQTEEDSSTDEEYMSPVASANTSLLQMAPPTGPQPRNSLQQQQLQGSSGFGSFASSIQSGSTRSGSLFVPPSCSSKMHVQEVQEVRISERTTICGDLNESSLAATSSSSLWAMPSVSLGTARQPLQRLDTTLGMSSYDVTEAGAAAAVAQAPTEYIELDEAEAEQEEQEQQRERLRSSCSGSDEEVELEVEVPMVGMDYQPSSSYSVSSELSAQDAPVYSIVVESTTTSITTSRSPTLHTPTSFLPSDTNVSLNSSPRAAGTAVAGGGAASGTGAGGGGGEGGGAGGATGNAGDASNRSIYRANSLETVDDLDTTKGSLEEDDDDVDMLDEDECVIALDGTEVRGYVARPELLAGACSSAELFSFKQKKDELEEGAAEHLPCPSLVGATLGGNSGDSAMGYTINLDSIESAHNESVATVHKQQEAEGEQQEGEENVRENVIDSIEESASDQVILVESDCELVDATAHESDVEIVEQSLYSDADSQHSLVLTVSDNEEEEVLEVTADGNKAQLEQQQRQQELKQLEEQRLQEEKQQQEEQEKRLQEERRLQEEKRLQEEMQRLEQEQKQRLEEEEKQRLEEEKRLQEEKRLEEEKRLQEEKRLEEEKRLQEEKRLEEEKRLQEEKQRLDEEEKRCLEEKQQQQEEAEQAQRGQEMQLQMWQELLQENEQQMELDEEQQDEVKVQSQAKQRKQKQKQKPVEVEEAPVASSKQPMVRILRTRHNATPPTSSAVPGRPASAIGFESPASSPAPSPAPSPSPSPSLLFQMRRRLRSSERQQSASPGTVQRGTPSPATVSTAAGRRAQRQRRLRSDDSVASVDSRAELAKRVLRAGSMPAMSTVPVSTPKRRTRLLPKPLEVIQETGEASLMPRTRSRTQLNQSIVDLDVDVETPKRKLRSTSEPPREAAVAATIATTAAAARKPSKPKRTRKTSVASSVGSTDGLPTEDSPQPRVLRSRRSTAEEPLASPAPSPTPEVSHANETHVPPKKRGRPRK